MKKFLWLYFALGIGCLLAITLLSVNYSHTIHQQHEITHLVLQLNNIVKGQLNNRATNVNSWCSKINKLIIYNRQSTVPFHLNYNLATFNCHQLVANTIKSGTK